MIQWQWGLWPVFGVLFAILAVLCYAAWRILMKNVDTYYCAG